jgi:hypothetical protein
MPLQTATKCRSNGIVGWGRAGLANPIHIANRGFSIAMNIGMGSAAAQLI